VVADALVAVDATDCHGTPVHLEARSDASGVWRVAGVPAGSASLTISSGSFVQHESADVVAGTVTPVGDLKTCFHPTAVKMAVVTGRGDHIEDLLTALGFAPDVVDGNYGTTGTPPGLAFVADPTRLAPYQILFFDCKA